MRHIAVVFWERAAKMVVSCLPVFVNMETELLGNDFSNVDFEGRGRADSVQ
jgi:hypothetical protein